MSGDYGFQYPFKLLSENEKFKRTIISRNWQVSMLKNVYYEVFGVEALKLLRYLLKTVTQHCARFLISSFGVKSDDARTLAPLIMEIYSQNAYQPEIIEVSKDKLHIRICSNGVCPSMLDDKREICLTMWTFEKVICSIAGFSIQVKKLICDGDSCCEVIFQPLSTPYEVKYVEDIFESTFMVMKDIVEKLKKQKPEVKNFIKNEFYYGFKGSIIYFHVTDKEPFYLKATPEGELEISQGEPPEKGVIRCSFTADDNTLREFLTGKNLPFFQYLEGRLKFTGKILDILKFIEALNKIRGWDD